MTLFEQGCWLAVRQPDRAVEPLADSLRIRARLEDRRGVAECLESIAQATRHSAPAGRCAELFGLAGRIRDELQAPLPERRRRQMRACLEAVASSLGEQEFQARVESGKSLSEVDGIARALEYCGAAAHE
jgi:hypothetical protein